MSADHFLMDGGALRHRLAVGDTDLRQPQGDTGNRLPFGRRKGDLEPVLLESVTRERGEKQNQMMEDECIKFYYPKQNIYECQVGV